ncbi:hypothetical protein GCM10018966_098390 [Streptomyces yanii]
MVRSKQLGHNDGLDTPYERDLDSLHDAGAQPYWGEAAESVRGGTGGRGRNRSGHRAAQVEPACAGVRAPFATGPTLRGNRSAPRTPVVARSTGRRRRTAVPVLSLGGEYDASLPEPVCGMPYDFHPKPAMLALPGAHPYLSH